MKSQSIISLFIVSVNSYCGIVSSFTTKSPSLLVRNNIVVDRKTTTLSPQYTVSFNTRRNVINNKKSIQNYYSLAAIQKDADAEIMKSDVKKSKDGTKTKMNEKPSNIDNYNNENDNEPKIISKESNEKRIDVKGLDERDETVNFSEDGLGAYDPAKKLPLKREVIVGDPQLKVKKEEKSVAEILTELAAIQKQGPQKYCILGSRHVSYLHQQIIELLSYALVLSENHVYTSGAMGTNAAAIRGALRAGRPDLLTVILPQSLHKQTDESQELLRGVTDLITMPQNDDMSLDVASRLCNSKLLSETDQLVAFAFHESGTVIEATKEAKKLEMLVTTLYLD